jgi:hypothetical protein
MQLRALKTLIKLRAPRADQPNYAGKEVPCCAGFVRALTTNWAKVEQRSGPIAADSFVGYRIGL